MRRQAIYTEDDFHALRDKGRIWNFHDEDTNEHLHTLHPYPAKFIPQIPRTAIARWSKRGNLVYDPFCGCGTTLLEASLAGRPSIGTDNNAVAILVARAKTTLYSPADLDRLTTFARTLSARLETASPRKDLVPENKNFHYWYSNDITQRLAVLKGVIIEEPEPNRTLLLAVFSAILVRLSYQDSDTRYVRVVKTIPASSVESTFQAKLQEVLLRLPELLTRTRAKSTVEQADARAVPMISTKSVHLIVTSPPYLNAYDYHKYHRQRLHWINGDVAFARDAEIGSHDQFTRTNAIPEPYFEDMNQCFAEWARVLRRGGHALIIIGDAIVSGRPVKVGDRFIQLLSEQGLALEERWVRELHATKRAFNVRNSRITHEHVLLFRRA